MLPYVSIQINEGAQSRDFSRTAHIVEDHGQPQREQEEAS
jgi:hypothetical protein